MSTVYDRLDDYPKKAGEEAFKEAIRRLRDTCGLSHEMADTIVRVFAKELADSLIQNKLIEIPHLGTIYYYNKLHSQGIAFRVSQEFKATRNKGGTDENNFIRAIEKSAPRGVRRDANSIKSSE
jgi:nucleoid DNA-binding protein